MRFDHASLIMLRDPFGDESMVDVVRAAAVCDAGMRVSSAAMSIGLPWLSADLLSPEADIAEHFRKYRPDILILPSEYLLRGDFPRTTNQIEEYCRSLPALVTIGKEPPEDTDLTARRYCRLLHADLNLSSWQIGDCIRRFVLREVMTAERLTEKLRLSARLVLRAMHADESSEGFNFLLDEVVYVTVSGYNYIDSPLTLHKAVYRKGHNPARIGELVKDTADRAAAQMTDTEYRLCFGGCLMDGRKPNELDFIYSAARNTAFICADILRCLSGVPELTKFRSYEN